MPNCPAPDIHRCHCGFGTRTISILFLSLVEMSYTVFEEREIRRSLDDAEYTSFDDYGSTQEGP